MRQRMTSVRDVGIPVSGFSIAFFSTPRMLLAGGRATRVVIYSNSRLYYAFHLHQHQLADATCPHFITYFGSRRIRFELAGGSTREKKPCTNKTVDRVCPSAKWFQGALAIHYTVFSEDIQ